MDSTIVFLPSVHLTQRIALELLPMRMGAPGPFLRKPLPPAI